MTRARMAVMADDRKLAAAFLEMLAAERGAAKNTLESYARDLADYAAFLRARGRDALTAGTADVRGYMADLEARGFKATSAARRLSAIRQLHRFLYAENHRSDDPTTVIAGPRRGRPLPKVLSMAEVDRLLSAAAEGIEDGSRPVIDRCNAARMAALLELLYAT